MRDDAVVFLSVRNWEKFQHYKAKTASGWKPLWIKLHIASSDDYAYTQLSLKDRGVLMELWKLAGRLDNQIPHDPRWLSRAMGTDESITASVKNLLSAGFLVSSSQSLGNGYAAPMPEESREEENRKELSVVKDVYDHWVNARSKTDPRIKNRISDNRRTKIVARLREFSADELKRAIDGVALDPWEDRSRNDDLTLIFRNEEQVQKFLALYDDPSVLTQEERLRRHFASLEEKH